MKRKIGILTYFWAHNPGTFLQAYSMLEALKKHFPEDTVEIINCRIRKVNFKICRNDINIFSFVERYQNHRTYEQCNQVFLPKSPNGLVTYDYNELTEYLRNQEYDLIVVGADTVLEFLPKHIELGQIPIYWIPPEVECKKVFFSASAGAFGLSMIPAKTRELLAESVKSFDLIGARDDNTCRLLQDLRGESEGEVCITPDPAFGMTIDYSYSDQLLTKRKISFTEPTIAINLPEKLPLCKHLTEYYQRKKNRVVMLSGARNERRLPLMSPFEWSGVHRHFTLEITDRFHGSIFSLKNTIPPVAVDYEQRKRTKDGLSKTYSLMKSFNMEKTNHVNTEMMTDFEEISKFCDQAIESFDPNAVIEKCIQRENEFSEFMGKVTALIA